MSEYTHEDVSYSAQLAAELERQRRQQLEAERRRREEEERRRREEEERRRREEEERKRRQEMADEKARGSWASRLEELVRQVAAAAEEDARHRTPRPRGDARAQRIKADAAALPDLVEQLRQAIRLVPPDLPRELTEVVDLARRVATAAQKGTQTDPVHLRQCVDAALDGMAELPRAIRRHRQDHERRRSELVRSATGLLARLAAVEFNSPLPSLKESAAVLRTRVESALEASIAEEGEALLKVAGKDLEKLEAAFEVAHAKSFQRQLLLNQVLGVLENLGYEASALPPEKGDERGDSVHLLRDTSSPFVVRAAFALDGSVSFDAVGDENPKAAERWCRAYDKMLADVRQLGLKASNRYRIEPGDARGRKRRRPLSVEESRILEPRRLKVRTQK